MSGWTVERLPQPESQKTTEAAKPKKASTLSRAITRRGEERIAVGRKALGMRLVMCWATSILQEKR